MFFHATKLRQVVNMAYHGSITVTGEVLFVFFGVLDMTHGFLWYVWENFISVIGVEMEAIFQLEYNNLIKNSKPRSTDFLFIALFEVAVFAEAAFCAKVSFDADLPDIFFFELKLMIFLYYLHSIR